MNDERRRKHIELEQLALNLEYSFNRGVDIPNRVIRLTEDIEDHHFDWFDAALTTLENLGRKSVTVKISSYGGDMYAALAIIARMRRKRVTYIQTEGYGKIMSGATAILAAGDKRFVSEYAHIMHHEPSQEISFRRHSEIKDEVRESERMAKIWAQVFADCTGLPRQFWYDKGSVRDFYMTPEDCIRYNIADGIF